MVREMMYGESIIGHTELAIDRKLITTKVFKNISQVNKDEVSGYFQGQLCMEREFVIKSLHSLEGLMRHAYNFLNKLDTSGPDGEYWKLRFEKYGVLSSVSEHMVLIPDVRLFGAGTDQYKKTVVRETESPKFFDTRTFTNKFGSKLESFDHFDRTYLIGAAVNAIEEVAK